MAKIDVNGIGIAYEIIGNGKRTAVITPGGRFSKDTPGLRDLAQKLAEGGFKTLIWDRPNCGESDFCFSGTTESRLNADTLAGLLRALKFGPTVVIGGSAGSRVSLLTAIHHPDVVERLFVLWISGSMIALAGLAYGYCHDPMLAAATGGMEAVAGLPLWKEQLERNPGNRERLLRQDPNTFIKTMQAWGAAFIPDDKNAPVPGLLPSELAKLKIPVVVLRSGKSDIHHPRETSEAVHAMIPGAKIAEPPWGDREWLDRLQALTKGEGLFARWPLLAPQILAFAAN
jgi:pimeloyl-ACP methyl ester carboxylesterase